MEQSILVLPFIKMCQVMDEAEDEHTMNMDSIWLPGVKLKAAMIRIGIHE